MNVCCNKLFRKINAKRSRSVIVSDLILNKSDIDWRKAQTIKASDDWIKRNLKPEGDPSQPIKKSSKQDFEKPTKIEYKILMIG